MYTNQVLAPCLALLCWRRWSFPSVSVANHTPTIRDSGNHAQLDIVIFPSLVGGQQRFCAK